MLLFFIGSISSTINTSDAIDDGLYSNNLNYTNLNLNQCKSTDTLTMNATIAIGIYKKMDLLLHQLLVNNTAIIETNRKTATNQIIIPLWIGICCCISFSLLVLGTVLLVVNKKMKQQDSQNELKKQVDFYSKLAFNTQIKPHFVVNSINAIQFYILSNDKANSSKYLNIFSKFLSSIFKCIYQQSNKLKEELNMLRLYLELQKMRYDGKFDYSVTIANNLNEDYIELPPLLLHPFIEDAIVKGVLQKDEKSSIQIEIFITNKHLDCRITDTGIPHAELVTEQITDNNLQIAQKRINLINQYYHTDIHVETKELSDSSGKHKGTQVDVFFPVNDERALKKHPVDLMDWKMENC